MKPESESKTPEALICDAINAIEVLEQSCRESAQQYREKIRKLRAVTAVLLVKRSQSNGELFDVSATVSPEIMRLIQFPAAR